MIRLLAVTSLLGMCMTGCYVVGPWCNGFVGLSVIARSAGKVFQPGAHASPSVCGTCLGKMFPMSGVNTFIEICYQAN